VETPSTASSYRDARALITRLIDLSGELVDGLDPVGISQNVLDLAREELPLTGAVLYTRAIYGVTPVVEGDVKTNALEVSDAVVELALVTASPVATANQLAFPLLTDDGVLAVVAGSLEAARPDRAAPLTVLEDLSRPLAAKEIQLDTAILLTTIREEDT